jgi:hypothetical protein
MAAIIASAVAIRRMNGSAWPAHDPEKLPDFSDKIMRKDKKIES